MMARYSFFILIFYSFSCAKINLPPTYYNVEDFRIGDMSDYQTIRSAIDSVKDNSTLVFGNKTYNLDHTIFVYKKINFVGNSSVIKRENQIEYTLKESANSTSKYLILNSTSGLIVKDNVFCCFSNIWQDISKTDFITKINGDTLFFQYGIGTTGGGLDYYPAGTKLYKNLVLFWIANQTIFPEIGVTFKNITIDGNRDNNKASNYWNVNTAVVALVKGYTNYTNCTFLNSSNETIAGHNAKIVSCTFKNLNGSAFHTSSDKQTANEDQIHSYILNSTFENTNQIKTKVTGHSEGCITHSNSGGYYTATGNTFTNVGEAVLGQMYPSVSIHDWGTSNISFTGNTINSSASRIVFGVALIPGVIHDVRVQKNTIINLMVVPYDNETNYWPDIVIKQKTGE